MAGKSSNKKIYIINASLMAFIIICTTAFVYAATKCHGPYWQRVTLEIISRIFFVFSIFEAFQISNRMIYVDSFTQCKNGLWVMKKSVPLYRKKKLGSYTSLYANIKEFKYYNQRFGTPVADSILRLFTKQLSLFVEENGGYCGRLGGDNFFILIPQEQTQKIIDYIKNVIVNIEYEGEIYNLHVKGHAGICYLNKNTELKDLIFFANIAYGYGKERFQDFTVFEPNMLEEYTKEKSMIADMQRALKAHEFIPYYQPKVNVKTNKLSGAEALVRWNKKDQLIPPLEFISAMEKAGVIDEIDFCVFEQVCKDIRSWMDQGIEPVRVSTNFSKLNLKNPDFIKRIIETKEKYNIDGKYLEVELTESAGVTNFDVIQQFASEIKLAGMSVAIDDFGTGYSSLSMLQTVHADVVKMDKSFLDNCFQDDGDGKQFIVDVITIVRHQNSEVLFEGVETQEQLDFLREYDCDTIQGFYFDEPLPHDIFTRRLLKPQY